MPEQKRKQNTIDMVIKQGGLCYLCGQPLSFQKEVPNSATVDHVTPKVVLKSLFRSAGENIKPWNEMAAGAACNSYKGKSPLVSVWHDLHQLKLCEARTWAEVAQKVAKHKERKL